MIQTRRTEMLFVLGLYRELALSGIPFEKIVDQCCRRIPVSGIESGHTAAEVLEAACEATVGAMSEDRLRGPAIANYVVATFKNLAGEGLRVSKGQRPSFGRYGLSQELAEIRRACQDQDRDRATAITKPRSTPDLPKRALTALKARPVVDDFPRDSCVRVSIKPTPYRDIETEHTAHIADSLPIETVREAAEVTREQEQRTREVVAEHARRRVRGGT